MEQVCCSGCAQNHRYLIMYPSWSKDPCVHLAHGGTNHSPVLIFFGSCAPNAAEWVTSLTLVGSNPTMIKYQMEDVAQQERARKITCYVILGTQSARCSVMSYFDDNDVVIGSSPIVLLHVPVA